MRLHRIKAGHYTAMIDGSIFTIVHSIHWDIYYDSGHRFYICSAHTLTDARAMLEGIIGGGLIL